MRIQPPGFSNVLALLVSLFALFLAFSKRGRTIPGVYHEAELGSPNSR